MLIRFGGGDGDRGGKRGRKMGWGKMGILLLVGRIGRLTSIS